MSSSSRLPLHLFHMLVVGPAFVYVGLQRENTPEPVFTVLGLLGIIILFYHSYLAYNKLKEGKSAWVNWIHILLVAPLLLVLGYLKKDASRRYFEMLMLLGFASIGYHGLYLIREMMFN